MSLLIAIGWTILGIVLAFILLIVCCFIKGFIAGWKEASAKADKENRVGKLKC